MVRLFTLYGEYLREKFGCKVQKLSVNAGFSCPNRDGTIGHGGCIYCDNRSFTPSYCTPFDSVTEQLVKGKAFFGRKYPDMKYLAYFQAYTSTYSASAEHLLALYREALAVEDVIGLVIGTRPDCFPRQLSCQLGEINREGNPVLVEFGAETSHDATLRLINRGHTWLRTVEAVHHAASAGLDVGLHFIMGLPGETEEMMLETVQRAVGLPVSSLKFHQLQVIKGTPLHRRWERGEISLDLFTVDAYLSLCRKICAVVPPSIAIERFTSSSPADLLIVPKWGIKNYEFVHRLQSGSHS